MRKEVWTVALFDQFDALFDVTRERLGAVGNARAFVPPADLVVTADEVLVMMDVPGLTAESLEIELTGDVLTVRGERAYPHLDGDRDRKWYRLERGYGRFQRMLQMPKGLDPDRVTASISDGVLTLHIPQPEARRPRRIEISTGASAADLDGGKIEMEQHTNGHRELAGAAA
jgi:HSP20 family protein